MARKRHALPRRAFTLVEMLVAMTLTLVMMGAVASMFGVIGQSVAGARATLEMSDALRGAAAQLRQDLQGIEATGLYVNLPANYPAAPPGSTAGIANGYFEYTEGPIGPVIPPDQVAMNNDTASADNTVGDNDDMLMFTTQTSSTDPFVGRYYDPTSGANTTIQSNAAEVAWFVRGNKLYRRQLLLVPSTQPISTTPAGFYRNNDISVRQSPPRTLVINDPTYLKTPQNRYAHQPLHLYPSPTGWSMGMPYHPHFCVDYTAGAITYPSPTNVYPTPWSSLAASVVSSTPLQGQGLGLPTFAECSASPLNAVQWSAGGAQWYSATVPMNVITGTGVPSTSKFLPLLTSSQSFDAWFNPFPWDRTDPMQGSLVTYSDPSLPLANQATRVGEDVVLNNVIGFDVKAWDPRAPIMQITRTRAGVTDVFVVLPGDLPHAAETNNPNAPLYTGYLPAVAQFVAHQIVLPGTPPTPTNLSSVVTDTSVTPNITYVYARIGTGAYVDLNYLCRLGPRLKANGYAADDLLTPAYPSPADLAVAPPFVPTPEFFGAGDATVPLGGLHSGLRGTDPWPMITPLPANQRRPSVYDTWTDNPAYAPYSPPYPGVSGIGLQAIQVKIRVFEPDSRQIREVTIVQDFLPTN